MPLGYRPALLPAPTGGQLLTHLGMAPDVEAAYRIALERPLWTVEEFAARLAEPPDQVAAVLAELTELDLVRRTAEGVRPVNPQLGLTALIARREAEMAGSWHAFEQSRLAAANLVADFDSAHRARIDGALDVTHGLEAVRARVTALVSDARTEVLSMLVSGSGYLDPVAVPRRADLAGASAGVKFRTVAMDRVRQDPLTLRHLNAATADGVAVRTAPEVPMSALVIDSTTAVFPLSQSASRQRVGAVVLHLPSVVVTTIELFERVWAEATPLHQSADRDTPDERSRELLLLMLAGCTDEAAAARLAVSVRTVRRLVSDLMDRLGSRSRFQAGALAAERGWINPPMLRSSGA
jgi:DNA-binding CsgD family transcriptional regulator